MRSDNDPDLHIPMKLNSQPDDTNRTSTFDGVLPEASPPIHPIARMQGAFNESIMESTESPDSTEATTPEEKTFPRIDAEARRKQLMELEDFSEEYSSRWRQKAGAKFHPLWKLIAQISFGVHLLQQKLAKSDEEVLRILQVHVDEVDGFLEDTTADFELAMRDVQERVKFLRLPLEHGETFNTMLNDKKFRTAIVDGNDVIERIIDRTTRAMNNSLLDVSKGIDATAELAKFLDRLGSDWTKEDERLLEIYNTMRGNAEGWYRTFILLQEKAAALEKLLTELGILATEMSRRAGAASRRQTANMSRTKSASPATSPHMPRSPSKSKAHGKSYDKPLPPDPLQMLLSKASPTSDPKPAHRDTSQSRHNTPSAHTSPISERPPRKSSSRRRNDSSRSQEDSKQQHSSSRSSPVPPPEPTKTAGNLAPSSSNQIDEGPAELPADSPPVADDPKFSTLIPLDHELPRNTSPSSSDKSYPTNNNHQDTIQVTKVETANAPSHETARQPPARRIQRRHSSADVLPSIHGAPALPPLSTTVTALPEYPQSSSGKWVVNGKRSFASVRGIFNKKRPLKESHMAILV